MIDVAYAMAPPGAQGAGSTTQLIGFLPIVLIFIVFYLLLIRPQQKKQKEHQIMLDHLKKGDAVITNGGLYGKITSLSDQILTLEIADKVQVRVSRGAIAGLASSGKEQS